MANRNIVDDLTALGAIAAVDDYIVLIDKSTGQVKSITTANLVKVSRPISYNKVMIGNEVFTDLGSDHLRCFLDPGGADRNFNPSGAFPSGFKVEIVNNGQEIITFDSAGTSQNVGPGQLGTFLFDGSVWY